MHIRPKIPLLGAVARTTGWLTLSRLIMALAASIAGLIAASELGPSGRGEVAVGLLVGYTAAVAGILGVENTLATVAAGRPYAHCYRLGWSLTRPSGLVLAAATIAGAGLAQQTGWYPWHAAVAAAAIAVGTAGIRISATAGAASGDMRRQPTITIVSGVLLVAGALALAARGDSSPTDWLWLYGLSSIAGVASARPRRESAADHTNLLTQLRHNAGAGLIATFTNFLTLRADRFLLPLLADTRQLGLYVVAGTIVDLAATPSKAASMALISHWRVHGPPPLIRTITLSLTVSTVGAAMLYTVGRAAIPAALGPGYDESVRLLAVLAPAVVFYLGARAVHARQLALGDHRSVGLAETVGFGVAIAGYVVLIPIGAAMGAAIGSLLGYATSFVVGTWQSAVSRSRNADARPVGSPVPPR